MRSSDFPLTYESIYAHSAAERPYRIQYPIDDIYRVYFLKR
jgi:hypothetical protein